MSRTRALFSRAFWLDTAERCIKAFASGASGVWIATDLSLAHVAYVGGVSAGAMLLMSVASVSVPAMSPASVAPPGA